jgi:hypothetical protein
MGNLSDFEREQIIGVSLAGESVIKTTRLLGASRVFFFNSQLHLQSVQEHSAKGVRRGTWRGAPSSAPPQVLGVKPRVLGGKETYVLNLKLRVQLCASKRES